MAEQRLIYRVHALKRMFQRRISERDVRDVLENGMAIEHYPDDKPYPSRLVLGFVEGRPIHVVAAYDPLGAQVIITVYEPAASRWDPTFRRRIS